jgi:hypothetical protein
MKKPARTKRKKKPPRKEEPARPFLEDGGQFGISKGGFRRLRKAEKRELMIEWFHQNFEDPAERTPYESAEGGYQWIWGGPYDARDQLEGKFGGLAPESLIEEVVNKVEEDGLFDWAPTPSRDDYDEGPPDEEPPSLDIFLDEPSPQYGTAQEHEARVHARTALDELGDALEKPIPIGIGHNRPPEDEQVPVEVTKLRISVTELRAEFAKPEPAIPLVKRWSRSLRDAVIASGKWAAKKVDKAVDAAMATLGAGIALAIGAQYSEPLHKALTAIIEWLMIAARTVF